jgi:mycofactocin system glycosyltransferase
VSVRYVPDRWLKRLDQRILAGGSPWRLLRVSGPTASIVDQAVDNRGVEVCTPRERAIVHALVDRGILHPRPARRAGPHDVTVVVPVYGRPSELTRCLRSLAGLDVIVVDDATPHPSPLRAIAEAAGVRYLRLPVNHGPAAARNAGAALATTALLAFVDSDCQPSPGWLDRLVPFFDDPRVAAVAPRVVAGADDRSVLSRFEAANSALDMGRRPALVRPGARLGFVPSATLLVRRDIIERFGFDEALRLGEDVDLGWRLADAGHHVRFEPTVVVRHDAAGSLRSWAGRRFAYGTSAVELEARHPGRLAPLRVSPWNLAFLGLLGLGRPMSAAAVSALATGLLARRLRGQGIRGRVAVKVMAAGLGADALAVGHALRREYWPVAAAAAVAAPRSRLARFSLALVAAPVLAEWVRERPRLDPLRFSALRLLADGAYGSGVLASCARRCNIAPLKPQLRRR